jgi:hypothetical protein
MAFSNILFCNTIRTVLTLALIHNFDFGLLAALKSMTTMGKTKLLRTIMLPAEARTQLIKNSTVESAKTEKC